MDGKDILNFIAEHPILTVIIIYMICATIVDVSRYIASALKNRNSND